MLSEKITNQVTVELFNVQGQQLSRLVKTGPAIKLNTSFLNPGFYFLKISSQNQLGYQAIIKSQ
ncbi:MAG: T9SS type A sorting domain-containing protein [Saprospiraceae bacterium]|nr:T9SS type A sorting domain-containing protein [Saprospiraceae bacterium]